MKILRIEGENIASLFGPFCVDFSAPPFVHTGVFAICGPTGSGKSTLLDAMCLALYGRTPRLRGLRKGDLMVGEFSATEARSLLSRGCTYGHAAVHFESARGQFRAVWRVEKPKKKLKEKTTKDAEARLFQIHSDGEFTLLDMRNRDMAEFVGLDFEQFTRTALLAQGEFRKFLDSTADERSKLLEKLTDTHIYADLGKASYERYKWERERLQDLQTKLKEIECLAPDLRTQKESELHECMQQLTALRALDSACQESIRWHHTETNLRDQERELLGQRQGIAQQEDALRPEIQNLADWDQCAPLRSLTEDWRKTKGIAEECTNRLETLSRQFSDLQKNKLRLEQELSKFLEARHAFETIRLQEEKELLLAESLDRTILENKKQQQGHHSEQTHNATKVAKALAELHSLHASLQNQSAAQLREQSAAQSLHIEQLKAAMESLQVYLRHRAVLQNQEHSGTVIHESMRQSLVRGTPCPVCGGLEHPATLHDPHAELHALQEQYSRSEALWNQTQNRLHIAERLPERNAQFRALREERNRIREALRQCTLRDTELLAQRKDLLGGRDTQAVRNALDLQRKTLAAQEQALQKALPQAAADLASTETLIQDNTQRKLDSETTITQLLQSIQQSREQLGLPEDRARLLLGKPAAWAQEIRARIDYVREQRSKTEGSLEVLRRQLDAHAQQRPHLDQATAEEQSAHCKQHIPILERSERELSHLLSNDTTNQNKQGSLRQQIAVQALQETRWSRLHNLIGSAEGDKFRTFAQNITLRRLTSLANQHLTRLHSRYQLKAWSNMELVIEDLDMGNELRSTRSLSGGEGFLVSMALALGLSDMASRQTPIGSLFIDEGFGTLDSDTLQSVVSVLEELRQQGRMVGIISHVDGLARQLGAAIRITPMGNGRSQLQIMGN